MDQSNRISKDTSARKNIDQPCKTMESLKARIDNFEKDKPAIENEYDRQISEMRKEQEVRRAAVREEYESQIMALRTERDEKIAGLHLEYDKKQSSIEKSRRLAIRESEAKALLEIKALLFHGSGDGGEETSSQVVANSSSSNRTNNEASPQTPTNTNGGQTGPKGDNKSSDPEKRTIYCQEPMTLRQTGFLLEKMKNLKKTKNSPAFLSPVDPVALNVPTYPDVVKHPMDLNTMHQKLKSKHYASVQAFADDFDLIISNTRLFHGDAHPVAQAGFGMEAYFRKMMESFKR